MDYYIGIARTIEYIERNLTEKLSLRAIAAQANLSVSHLYRIFPAVAGCSVGQYVRRRRLSEAARALEKKGRILDVALEYQFESQESFTRAFKSTFGITPGEYKRDPAAIPVCRPIQLIRNEKGNAAMQPGMLTKKFVLIGLEAEVDLNADFSGQIAALTSAFKERLPEICGLVRPVRAVNMWYAQFRSDSPAREPATLFFTGAEIEAGASYADGMTVKDVPESLYAVFEETRRGTIGGPDGYAYKTWLPDSGYALSDEVPGDFEVYPDTEHVGYDDACEIWIPLCGVTK